MQGRIVTMAGMAACLSASILFHSEARAQSAGSVLGGVLGGAIAGSIIANSQPRTVVVYGRPRYYRSGPPRRQVARARRNEPKGTGGAAVVNASSDPFAKSQGSPTTAVSSH